MYASRLRRWFAKIPAGLPSRTTSGFSARRRGQRARHLLEELRQDRAVADRDGVLALERAHAVRHHVGVALRVIEEVVALPGTNRPLRRARAVEIRVRVAEEIAPRLEEPQELHVARVERLRGADRRIEPGDVGAELADARPIPALRRRQPEAEGVVPEHGVGLDEVRVVLIARHLREVVLHHPHGLAHRLEDPELAIGVVVRPQRRPPEDEVVRAPAEAVRQLVIHDGGDRGREHGARRRGLAGGKRRRDVERQPIVSDLSDVQRDDRRQPDDDDRRPRPPAHDHASHGAGLLLGDDRRLSCIVDLTGE